MFRPAKLFPEVKTALKIFYAWPVVFALVIFGYLIWLKATHQGPPTHHISSTPFATVAIAGLQANLFTDGDQLRASGDDLFIEFRDQKNNLVDVGNVTFELNMNMPDMVMHSMGKVMRTGTAGQYRSAVEPQMAGDWTGKISFTGPRGTAETNFPVAVK